MTADPTPSGPAPPDGKSAFAIIREAIHGSQQDYTSGPIGRAILLLAIPMVLEMAMESVFAVVDVFFVSRLGPDAVATVGLTESMLTIMYTAAMGLSIGVTAMVARRIGEKNPEGAGLVATQAIGLGVTISALIGIGGLLTAPALLRLMGAEPSVIDAGAGYTRIMLAGNGTILLLFMINAIFRGAGDPAIAMRALWLANGINIVLDPTLILGLGPFPALGIEGAAIATNIGRGTAVLYQLHVLTRERTRLIINRDAIRVSPLVMWQLMRLSGTGMLQFFIGMASWVGLIRILATFGSDVLAGYTIGIRLIIFALLPSWGLSNAASTMVGQALGADAPDRAERAVWRAGLYNMVFLGSIGIVFMILAPQLIAIFTPDPIVSHYGIQCLRIVSGGFLFYAYGMVLTASFNGAGDTWTPTIINFFCFWVFELPMAILLSIVLGLGPWGVFLTMTLSFSSLAVVSAVVFRRGRWKLKKV